MYNQMHELADFRAMQALLRITPSAVAVFDTEMRYLMVTSAWVDMYGLAGVALLGKSHYDIFPEISSAWRDVHKRVLQGATLSNKADPFTRADGQVQYISWHMAPWFDSEGGLAGAVLFTEDTTLQIETDVRLRQTMAQIEHQTEQLEQQLSRTEHALDAANLAWFEVDITTGEQACNQRFYEVFSSASAKNVFDRMRLSLHSEDRERISYELTKQFDSPDCFSAELVSRINHKDFEARWVKINLTYIRDAQGLVSRVQGIVQDITPAVTSQHLASERARLEGITEEREAALARQNTMMERVERVGNIGTWEYNLVTGKISWSAQTRKIHEVGADFKPDPAQCIQFYEEGESREQISDAIKRSVATGEGFSLELTLITAKQNRLYVRAQGEVELKNGKPVEIFGTFQDVTDQRRLLDRIALEKDRLEMVLEGAGVGLCDINPQNGQGAYDIRACRIAGHHPSEIEPHLDSWLSRIHPDDMSHFERDLQEHFQERSAMFDNVHRIRHIDGNWIYIHARGRVAARTSDGKPLLFTCIVEDITKAEQAAQQRKQLYAMTAHELRTPLSALEMMSRAESRADWWSYKPMFQATLTQVFHTLDDMRMIINPVMQRPIRHETLKVYDFNAALVGLTTAVVTQNRMKLKLNDQLSPTLVNNSVTFDTYRLRAALVNLIKNACLHSCGSEIVVTCIDKTTDASGTTTTSLTWTVDDNGQGIDEETQQRLFEPYARGNSRADGTGMGLYISKRWLAEVGGTIDYARTATGSRFTVCIPVALTDVKTTSAQPTRPQALDLNGLRVLFVEDDRMLNMLGRKLLKQMGLHVESAADGQEAYQKLDNGYDLIITDYYMPKMNGEELLKRCRAEGYLGPIVVLTAPNLGDESDSLLRAGADDVVYKPLTPDMFKNLIAKLNATGRLTTPENHGVALH